jgi:hypothetical protein
MHKKNDLVGNENEDAFDILNIFNKHRHQN